MARNNKDYFAEEALSGPSLNWSKEDTQAKRRRNALRARGGNALKAARALQALANVSQDKETARKAKADAEYFFRLYKKRKKLGTSKRQKASKRG